MKCIQWAAPICHSDQFLQWQSGQHYFDTVLTMYRQYNSRPDTVRSMIPLSNGYYLFYLIQQYQIYLLYEDWDLCGLMNHNLWIIRYEKWFQSIPDSAMDISPFTSDFISTLRDGWFSNLKMSVQDGKIWKILYLALTWDGNYPIFLIQFDCCREYSTI